MSTSETELETLPDHPGPNFLLDPVQKWKALFLFVLLPVVLAYYFFLTVPFLEGFTDTAPVVYDSRTYMQFATDFPGLQGLVTMGLANHNLVGPLSLLLALGNNSLYVLIFNLVLFYLCLDIFFKSAQFNKTGFFIALVINPLMLSSLTSINKEVLSVCALLVTLAYSFGGRRRHLWLSILLSLLVRQELTVLIIGYAIGRKVKSKWKRIWMLVGAVLALSALLPVYDTSTVDILNANQTDNSVGISVFLSDLTSNYLYFIAVIPRIILNLFGDIKTLFGGGDDDLYGYSAWSGIAFFIACIYAKKRFYMVNDPFFLMVSYAILFATPSFIHHRYFFPVYVVLLALVFYKKHNGQPVAAPVPAPVQEPPSLGGDQAPVADPA